MVSFCLSVSPSHLPSTDIAKAEYASYNNVIGQSVVISLSPWSFCIDLLLLSYLKHTYDFATAKVIRHSCAARLAGGLGYTDYFQTNDTLILPGEGCNFC